MHTDLNPKSKLCYSVTEAVAATSVGRSLLYEEIKAGRLKAFKLGARTLIHCEDLSNWINRLREEA